MDFRRIFSPASSRPLTGRASSLFAINSGLRQNLTAESYMLLGACVQVLLLSMAPLRYAVIPAFLLMGIRICDTILVTTGVIKNPYLRNVVSKKVSAQIPDLNGDLKGPGQEKVAVLLLGFKPNHPLGLFDSDAATAGAFFTEMHNELEPKNNQDNGFLGVSSWQKTDENGAQEILNISYWRSIEDVHNYSQGPTHTKAIRWWNSNIKSLGHLGIMHEVFEAPAGMWESVYVNFQPTLMGRTTFLKRGGKTEGGRLSDEWVSSLVEARGALRTSNGRRGLKESQRSEAQDYD